MRYYVYLLLLYRRDRLYRYRLAEKVVYTQIISLLLMPSHLVLI